MLMEVFVLGNVKIGELIDESFSIYMKLKTKYRIDHGFEINIRGLAEDIYREIHGLS